MKFEKLNEKLFDGDDSEVKEVVMTCKSDTTSVQFRMQDLIDFASLEKIVSYSELSHVQSALNFEVIDFDGEKIFYGRKKGLRLYGYLSIDDQARCIFIFSCGEFQPSRFQIFLEGYLKE